MRSSQTAELRSAGQPRAAVSTSSFSALNRQCADSFLRRGVDRVAQRWGERRQRGFTDSRGRFLTWNCIDLHYRGLVHTERGVIVEVALHYASLVDCDLRAQGVGEAVHDSALNLLLQNGWVHDLSAIYCGDHAVHLGLIILHRDLDYFGQVGLETSEAGDASMVPGGERLVPACFLGGYLHHGAHACPMPSGTGVGEVLFFGRE